MTSWAVVVGLFGVIWTGAVVAYLRRRETSPSASRYWVCGLAALLPAWLISLLVLLGQWTGQGPDAPMPPSVILSSSGALGGVIVTDWVVRRLDRKGSVHHPITYWLLGVIAFLPPWVIAVYFPP